MLFISPPRTCGCSTEAGLAPAGPECVEPLHWGMNIKALSLLLPVIIRPKPPSLQRHACDWPQEAGRSWGVEVVLSTALAGNAQWEGQKAGRRLGTGAPKDLGAGLTSTPVPELPLGRVLNATPVFNENSYHL